MRRYLREQVDAAIEVWSGNQRERSLAGRCLNLSEAGLMMRVPQPIPLLSRLSFAIAELSFEGTGTVRHCGNLGADSIVGVEFSPGVRFRNPSG